MHLLAIRFSAMGDVALTVPVLRGVLKANPELNITIVTNAAFTPMFYGIERLQVYGIRLSDYKGIRGLRRLYNELKKLEKWQAIIDLHSVMRSWVLSGFFRLEKIPVYSIDKGREGKSELVNQKKKTLIQLKHSTERYLDVFREAGIQGEVESGEIIQVNPKAAEGLEKFFDSNGLRKTGKWIGIAPFSKHRQKTWPIERVKELIAELNKRGNYQIFLLGGPEEAKILKELASEFENTWNMAGLFSLDEEIALMYQLDEMIAMDSFNMHLAALCNTKVISIWGGTHRFAGFGPLNDNKKNIVEIPVEELDCRPCSVFGSKPCHRGDWACLEQIRTEDVTRKL